MKLNYATLAYLVVFLLVFDFFVSGKSWTAPHKAGLSIIIPSFVLFAVLIPLQVYRSRKEAKLL